ncbi:hypothetical protein M3181_12470 [Mesobacillus maritimus]|uniref:hypothetical protein n=1 Tax=Mesobacillus maritimus TaxID=1643336 RepID=UPI00203D58F1|nr:hypothetical protein [Mesobacillus maritimus]MCM3669813.1 hypothetical protein [Mesobacillus maritimus]
MNKPRIVKISYGNKMPEESTILFYRIIENLMLKSLPDEYQLKGMYLKNSLDEFSNYTNDRMKEIEDND